MNTLGSRIIQLRKLYSLSQRDLAKKIGVTEATLSRYENDLRQPKADIINKIAECLNTTTDYLLCNTDSPSPITLTTNDNCKIDLRDFPDKAVDEIYDYINYIKQKFDC